MSYLSISNFWKYQNADVWKKSKGHPPWFKHYVHRDRELDKLDPVARLLFYELLAAATRYSNVLEADLKWIWAETRVETEAIAEHLPVLLKGGWLNETATPRRSRKPSRDFLEEVRDLREEDEDGEEEAKGLFVSKGSTRGHSKQRLPDEHKQEIAKLVDLVSDADADTPDVFAAYAAQLPFGAVAKVRESVELSDMPVGSGYVVQALRSEILERQAS